MQSPRTLINLSKQISNRPPIFFYSSRHSHPGLHLALSQYRLISSTISMSSWMDKIKGVFTGEKEKSFTLVRFADELEKARKVGSFKNFVVGRSSQATFADAFGKMVPILKYLSKFDPNGENLQTSQKQEAAKHCNCTIADVESALAKYTWAKEAQMKLQKLKEEGKPIPKSIGEVQKLMGSTAQDIARSNLAKSGMISRNAFCPCGSKKRYKRCCGNVKET